MRDEPAFKSHVHEGPAARKGTGLAIGGQMIKASELEGDIGGLLGIVILINVEDGDDLGLLQGIGGNGGFKREPLVPTNRFVLGQLD